MIDQKIDKIKIKTIDYYNQNAAEFYENTVDVDLMDTYQEFLEHIKEGTTILDAGCGSGRDSLYFLDEGYEVTAIDASEKLVELSSNLIGQQVLHMRFEDINFKEEFAGIWACASLLHISRTEIESVLNKFIKALVRDGVIYLSFKYGDQEIYRNGRLFNYYDYNSFMKLKSQFDQLKVLKTWKTADAREERNDEYWFNVLLNKDK